MGKITSLNNDRVRRVQALQRSTRRRYREVLLVAEGYRLVSEILSTNAPIIEVFYTEAFAADDAGLELVHSLARCTASLWEVSSEVMVAISDTMTPQGILAVLPFPQLSVPSDTPFTLIPDRIRDPGNLGTILRTAWAAGVDQVLIPPATVDPFNSKVMRSGMGAHFHVPLRRVAWADIQGMIAGTAIWLAESGQGVAYDDVDWCRRATLIVGGEAEGAGAEAHVLAGERLVYIPMAAGVDSLNAAIATAVLLFEVAKQRRFR